jgi:hypothetical protein
LGTAECFQSVGDQVLHLGVDDSVFFTVSLNDFQGVCGHVRVYDHMFTSGTTNIGGGNKRHVFTPLEKEILVNLYNTNN